MGNTWNCYIAEIFSLAEHALVAYLEVTRHFVIRARASKIWELLVPRASWNSSSFWALVKHDGKPLYNLILYSPQNVFHEVCGIHVSCLLSSHPDVQLKTNICLLRGQQGSVSSVRRTGSNPRVMQKIYAAKHFLLVLLFSRRYWG